MKYTLNIQYSLLYIILHSVRSEISHFLPYTVLFECLYSTFYLDIQNNIN